MSVALCPDGIVLTLTERGYDELLGGHLEANETAVDAVLRESEEEGGIIIEHCKLVGIKRIENDPSDKPSRQQYPPVGYASYFVGYSSRYPGEPTGVEVVSRKVLPLDEAFSLDLAQFPERQEAILLLNAVLGCDIEAELRAGVSSAELISRVAAKLQEPPEFLKNAH
ncbi:MAG: NUDIX domain-containing protein [Deltaproteobacteria bacterium]|nr:NUDIX domain-containing protein [Deltaproteobacteria bacterium]